MSLLDNYEHLSNDIPPISFERVLIVNSLCSSQVKIWPGCPMISYPNFLDCIFLWPFHCDEGILCANNFIFVTILFDKIILCYKFFHKFVILIIMISLGINDVAKI